MKRIFLLVAWMVLWVSGSVQAATVDAATAQRVAVAFWNTHRPVDVKPVEALQCLSINGLQHQYVFVNDTNGFVIVAADDRVKPVIAYSFDSPFPTRLHPSLRYWLSVYEDQIAAAERQPVAADPRWADLLQGDVPPVPVSLQLVQPLCETRWNQSSPFNRQCPYDSVYGSRAVVGCVATAMAQIMKRWNHPYNGVGSHSYVHWNSDLDYNYGTLTADFANTTYRWDIMPNAYPFGASENEPMTDKVRAVSTISYHCGVSVDMMYGPSEIGGSGAYSSDCVDAFRDYFKYDPSLEYRERNITLWRDSIRIVDGMPQTVSYRADSLLIPDSVWLGYIDSDLANGWPIYYDGSDESGGHAFVLDGSNIDTTYHFNWGWGGYGDGYYTVDNLAPGGSGIGGNATYTFNHWQGAIFGIRPVPEQFVEVDLYDTTCNNQSTYYYYDYALPVADCDTHLHHLDTLVYLHLNVIGSSTLIYSSNFTAFPETFDTVYCSADPVVVRACDFERNKCRFIGWCRKKKHNNVEPVYQPGDTINLQGNVTLYAQWKDTTVGIDRVEDGDIRLWPNPTADRLVVEVDEAQNLHVNVLDVLGRSVLREESIRVESGRAELSLSGLPEGIYTVQVSTSQGTYNRRIIKQ